MCENHTVNGANGTNGVSEVDGHQENGQNGANGQQQGLGEELSHQTDTVVHHELSSSPQSGSATDPAPLLQTHSNPYAPVHDEISNISRYKLIESTLREGEQFASAFFDTGWFCHKLLLGRIQANCIAETKIKMWVANCDRMRPIGRASD